MGLLVREHGVGYLHADAEKLDRQLREGDGLVWSGDPRLELRIGVVTAAKRMQHPGTGKWINKNGLIAKRYEVYRYNEDGTETSIGHWRIEEFDRILFDVAGMKAGFEGKTPDVLDRIDAANAKVEKDSSDKWRDHYGALLAHAYSIAQEKVGGRLTHRQVGGSNEDAGRNLAKD